MKVLELKGPKSLGPLNVFHTLMLGLKMLPMYVHEEYSYFYERIELMAPQDQEKMVREALKFVELKPDEIERICMFAADNNGVPYTQENIKSLGLAEIFNIVVAVSLEVAKINIDYISDTEKKKLKTSPSTSDQSLPNTLQ